MRSLALTLVPQPVLSRPRSGQHPSPIQTITTAPPLMSLNKTPSQCRTSSICNNQNLRTLKERALTKLTKGVDLEYATGKLTKSRTCSEEYEIVHWELLFYINPVIFNKAKPSIPRYKCIILRPGSDLQQSARSSMERILVVKCVHLKPYRGRRDLVPAQPTSHNTPGHRPRVLIL